MSIKQYYIDTNALLEGHFLLSSGNHSKFYLQSAKLLEDPSVSKLLAEKLAHAIENRFDINCVCSPALGGVIIGYELARALGVRFIFTERVNGVMNLRRGFSVDSKDRILVCEDIITTGGSAVECANCLEKLGANVIAFAALASRGFCARVGSNLNSKMECKLPFEVPFFALEDFEFDMYSPNDCPMCKSGDIAQKPGSRNI